MSRNIPRYQVGDRVIAITGSHNGKQGMIMEIIQPSGGDGVYRYRVRFQDGTGATLFGFELTAVE